MTKLHRHGAYLLTAILLAVEGWIAVLACLPQVSDDYRLYYIERKLTCWPRRPEVYNIGDRIDFKSSDIGLSSRHYQRCGWGGEEELGTWTDGDTAELEFILSNSTNNLKLTVYANAFTRPNFRQHVTLFANGTAVGSYDVGPLDQVITAEIPGAVIKDGTLRIKFAIEEPIRPKDFNFSNDTRRLGLRVQWLEITATE